MKNPNSLWQRQKRYLLARWSSEDYPGAEPRFQIILLAKDISIFILLPILSVLIYSFNFEGNRTPRRAPPQVNSANHYSDSSKSQIIEFAKGKALSNGAVTRRTPGALVRLRLLNVVETYTTVPVHALVVDTGLGGSMLGAVLIGDATPDTNFERIAITFRYAKDPTRENTAFSISARALSLDGTLGLSATKKEGFITRSAIGSAGSAAQSAQGQFGASHDFAQILLRALTAGLVEEFGSETQVAKNRSQVLTLAPGTEFFAELTDFFPGTSK